MDKQTAKLMVYHNNEWVEVSTQQKKEEVLENAGFSLYSFNQLLMSARPPMEDFTVALHKINTSTNTNNRYMLLCKDISYYTIFEYSHWEDVEFHSLGEAVITCAQELGDIIDIDFADDEKSQIEIWIRTPEKYDMCAYLFNCEKLFVGYN